MKRRLKIPSIHASLEDAHAALRRQEKNAQLMDFKCVEFVEELMYGSGERAAGK